MKNEKGSDGKLQLVFIDLHKHSTYPATEGYLKYDWKFSKHDLHDRSRDTGGGIAQQYPELDDPDNYDPEHDRKWCDMIAHLKTGRFAEMDVIGFVWANERQQPEKLRNDVCWRVIMDDLWYLQDPATAVESPEEKGRISRVAYKIMKREANAGAADSWAARTWHLRSLKQIAEALDFQVEGIEARFHEALELYCQRPNSPALWIERGLSDTIFPALEHDVETESTGMKQGVGVQRQDFAESTDSSGTTTPSSTLSLNSTAASSATDLTSISDSAVVAGKEAEKPARIFIPKKNARPARDVKLGWM